MGVCVWGGVLPRPRRVQTLQLPRLANGDQQRLFASPGQPNPNFVTKCKTGSCPMSPRGQGVKKCVCGVCVRVGMGGCGCESGYGCTYYGTILVSHDRI